VYFVPKKKRSPCTDGTVPKKGRKRRCESVKWREGGGDCLDGDSAGRPSQKEKGRPGQFARIETRKIKFCSRLKISARAARIARERGGGKGARIAGSEAIGIVSYWGGDKKGASADFLWRVSIGRGTGETRVHAMPLERKGFSRICMGEGKIVSAKGKTGR